MIRIGCARKLNPDLIAEASGKGLLIEDKDLLRITLLNDVQLAHQLSNNIHPFVFTSSYAVKAVMNMMHQFGLQIKNTTAFCIEGKTAAQAADAGFNVLFTAPNSNQLAQLMLQHPIKQLLHAGANIRLDEWKHYLQEHGITVETLKVYHKEVNPQPFETLDGMIFMSPSQIEGFLAANTLPTELPAFCIGETTASFLAKQGHRNVIISTQSNEQALLNTVYHYFNQTQ